MEKFRVSNGDIELLVYEKSIRLKNHHQTIFIGRAIPKEDAVKYAAMFMDIKRSGANESPDYMFKRTTTVWKVYDDHLLSENEDLRQRIEDLKEDLVRMMDERDKATIWGHD
jgi:hypothetical protein